VEYCPLFYTTSSRIQTNKIAISLWLYHTDLWPEFYCLVRQFKDVIKLYIGLYKDNNNSQILYDIESNGIDAHISYYDNYGADIAPFLKDLSLITEDVFIKIHGKKSRLGTNKQINWKNVLCHSLLGSWPILVNNIHTIQQPNIGSICHRQLIFSNRESYHHAKILELCEILNINYNELTQKQFAAGSMFMGLTKIYQKYLNPDSLTILDSKLRQEHGKVHDQYPGTYSHALERIFGYIIEDSGLKFGFAELTTYKIFNKNKNTFFNLVIIHNKDCYLLEDINVYGDILHMDKKIININWLHQDKPQKQSYSIRHGFLIKI
jgi:lipopolysaccharide biosynthesis protein